MQTITFYSYKGGVGRSLALANIAKRLSEFNRKVCMIDFDLEAPGLQFKFSNQISGNVSNGIVDYIYSFTNEGNLPKSIAEYSVKFNLGASKLPIHLIPAGNAETPDYWKKLSSINWYDLLYENNGLSFFLDLKHKIKEELNPDFLLIDSRTGISEISGISISLLADEVVVVAANNKENLSGAKRIIQSISNPDNSILGTSPKITFVLSRVPFTNNPDDKAKEQVLISRLKKEFSNLYNEDVIVIHSDRELEENEKLKISSEFEDGFSDIARDYLKLFEKLTKENLTSEEIKKFNQIKEAERLFRTASTIRNPIERIELITKAIQLNEIPDYYLFRANLYLNIKKRDFALSDFNKVIEIDKNNFEGNYGIANIHFLSGQLDDALSILDKLLLLYPDEETIYFKKALIYDKLGLKEKELECYYKSLELVPDDSSVYNNLANHFRLEKQYEKALELIYKSLQLNPKQAIAFATLAEINAELNNINEFYLNLELAFLNKTDDLAESLAEEVVYQKFVSEDRFIKLLEKYNITIPPSGPSIVRLAQE